MTFAGVGLLLIVELKRSRSVVSTVKIVDTLGRISGGSDRIGLIGGLQRDRIRERRSEVVAGKVLKILQTTKEGSWIDKGSVAWAHNQRDYRNVD